MLRASTGPLFDADQKISGVVSSVRDITEAKTFEQQLLQKEKFASMGQMMAGAAHELNNPLTAILGVSDLAARTRHRRFYSPSGRDYPAASSPRGSHRSGPSRV